MVKQLKKLVFDLPISGTLVRSYFQKQIDKNIPIFVYQMGKVGSSSVYTSLKKQYDGVILHSHSFIPDHRSNWMRLLYEFYQNQDFEFRVVSLIREPVGRNLSAFFQTFERQVGVKYEDNQYTPQELKGIFLKNYDHDKPNRWFDEAIKTNFDIDVYESSFPKEGYQTIKKGRVHFLLMKHDIKDELKEKVIGDFIGTESFKLTNVNVGDAKEYNQTYKAVKALKLPKWYLEKMLNTRYANHFYEAEKESIIKRWLED